MGRPFVHSLRSVWRPQLAFYSVRAEMLAKLDRAGVLLRFRMPDDLVVAVVEGVGHLEIGPGHFKVDIASPGYDEELVDLVVDSMLSEFEKTTSRWECRVARIVAVDAADYESARRAAVRAWSRVAFADEVEDFAVLLDGRNSDGVEYQCEFGVISRPEAVPRLSLEIGRSSWGEPLFVPADGTDVPEIGAFSDWYWRPAPMEPMKLNEAFRVVRDRCLEQSDRHSDQLHRQLQTEITTMNDSSRRLVP